MSQDDSHQGENDRKPNDPRVNAQWTPAVSCSEGLAVILKKENKKLFEALRSYVDVALVDEALRKRWPGLGPEDLDDLFMDAVARLHDGERPLDARFAYLFGGSRKGQPGSLGAYVAKTAKNLYRSELRRAESRARREQKLIERQERLERTPSPLDVLMDQEKLDQIRKKLGKLFEAARGIIGRRLWNTLLEFIGPRWSVQLGELPPPWPDVVSSTNQGTRSSDRYRARAELQELITKYDFEEWEIAVLCALGIIHKSRRRDEGKGGKCGGA